jgi:metallo-beta-lactamase class B
MSPADAEQLAAGGTNDFVSFAQTLTFKPVKADLLLKDRQPLRIGKVEMVPVFTPGHTRGATTWTTRIAKGDETANVVFFSSTSILEKITENPKYPSMRADLEKTYAVLKELKCDIFMAPHGEFFDLDRKYQELLKMGKPRNLTGNPFYNPGEFGTFITNAEKTFKLKLQEELRTR